MVSPGMTLTEYSQNLPEKAKDAVQRQTPLRRLATPEDVAKVVLFYASPLADFVSGSQHRARRRPGHLLELHRERRRKVHTEHRRV